MIPVSCFFIQTNCRVCLCAFCSTICQAKCKICNGKPTKKCKNHTIKENISQKRAIQKELKARGYLNGSS